MVTLENGSTLGRFIFSTKLKIITAHNNILIEIPILLRVRLFLISSISSFARKYPFSFA